MGKRAWAAIAGKKVDPDAYLPPKEYTNVVDRSSDIRRAIAAKHGYAAGEMANYVDPLWRKSSLRRSDYTSHVGSTYGNDTCTLPYKKIMAPPYNCSPGKTNVAQPAIPTTDP